jgi:glycosyltransferase involved in cell wall biosynthesis
MFTVSIVTKTHNRLSYILECVASVQKLQNEPYDQLIEWEHVIYDDGSTDGTHEHFQSHTYPHTRYIRSESQKGIPVGANRVIESCKSDYIFELDSDDIVPQRILVNFYETLLAHPNVHWIITDFFREGQHMEYEVGNDYYGWTFKNNKEILKAICNGKHFIQHNALYRKDLWGKVGKYDESFSMAEDLDLYVRFLLDGEKPFYTPYISHLHRNHKGNISKKVNTARHTQDLKKIYHKYASQLTKLGIYESSIHG